jgi:hypothetical protein
MTRVACATLLMSREIAGACRTMRHYFIRIIFFASFLVVERRV